MRFLLVGSVARRISAVILVAVLSLVLVFLLLSRIDTAVLMVTPDLTVEVTQEDVIFTLYAPQGEILAAGLPVRISLASPAGPIIATAETQAKETKIRIPYVRAGVTPYELNIANQRLTGTLERQAGIPVGPLELKVGARMSRVTPDRKPALVIHPVDAQDNVTSLPVAVQADFPDGATWQRSITPKHLYAWTPLRTGTQVGSLHVSAVTADMRGERGEVDLVAGRPVSAELMVRQDEAAASGRDTWQLELANTQDRLGNPISDGVAVAFIGRLLTSEPGESPLYFHVTRPAIQGGQTLVLPSYPRSGDYDLAVKAGDFVSEALTLTASPISETQIRTYWLATQPLSLAVDSIYSSSGAFVDDGTNLELNVYAVNDLIVKLYKPLKNGSLTWTLPPLPETASRVETCLGGNCASLDLVVTEGNAISLSTDESESPFILPSLDFINEVAIDERLLNQKETPALNSETSEENQETPLSFPTLEFINEGPATQDTLTENSSSNPPITVLTLEFLDDANELGDP